MSQEPVQKQSIGSGSDPLPLLMQALGHMRPIEGWFPEDEATLLFTTACKALTELPPPGAVVEIGSYCGRSTVMLGAAVQAVRSEAHVFAIDPHEGSLTFHHTHRSNASQPSTVERFTRNITTAGLQNCVHLIQQRSYEVNWDQPITLIFIDGLHDYTNVSRDFSHFETWIRRGGYCAFHDYSALFPDVLVFVDEVLRTQPYRIVEQVGSLITLQKYL